MKVVVQHGYLSPEAKALRKRDGLRPWQIHVCEVDNFADWPSGASPFLDAARRLRDEIESE